MENNKIYIFFYYSCHYLWIIEVLQESLTQTRKAEINDVFFNVLGTLIGAFLIILCRKRLNILK